jgi:hypothetical protein
MIKTVPRLVRADDFVAETYEKMATNLPLSQTGLAGYYRRTAQMFRESTRPGMMRIWEEERVEFVESDSSSKR